MQDELFSVAGRAVLVSGGTRGIGYELARGFAARGAEVVITGRSRDTVEAAAARLEASGASVLGLTCDVSDIDAIRQAVDQVIEKLGRIDTLLNVAGVNTRKPAELYSPEEYDFIVNTNLRGAYFLSQAVGKKMIERREGNQINIDSYNTYSPLRHVLPYAMSKSGMVAMTRGLASEWGPHNVRVNSIAPGCISTQLTKKLWANPVVYNWSMSNTPLKRLGECSDLIGAALFLASDASSFVTGQTIRVDGGLTAGTAWPIDSV